MTNDLTRVTVNLVPRSMRALSETVAYEENSRTDTINRAIQFYSFMVKKMAEGHELCLIDPGGELHKITIL